MRVSCKRVVVFAGILVASWGSTVGCESEVVEERDEEDSGEGEGESPPPTPPGVPGPPGMPQGFSCNQCSESEECVTCNTASPETYGFCAEERRPDADEFACKWTACAVGDVCLDTRPAGDGCPDAECTAIPQDCTDAPTCACLLDLLGGNDCEVDDEGNITLHGWWFTP